MLQAPFRLLAALLITLPAVAQTNTTLLVDVDHRAVTSLDGDWHAIVDQYATGLYTFHQELRSDGFFMNAPFDPNGHPQDYNFSKAATLKVPGDWNTQRPELLYYEGPIWYQRDFEHTSKPNTRTFLHIGAANYRTFVWVNTKKICEHEGGFTPFDCEVTSVLKNGKNFVVLSVDNTRIADGVPTLQTDWWNYGGLTRDVSLVEVPQQFIDDYDLHLSRTDHNLIEGYVHVEGASAGTQVAVQIPELQAKAEATVDAQSRAAISIAAKSLSLWSPENPRLYKVEIASGVDKVEDTIGFRTIEARGTQILLNGQPVFLRGISIHAEAPYRTGRAYSQKDVDTLLGWAKELGCNYVRLAHYPHDERMTRTADKLGLMVWSEIPDYWALQFDNPAVLAKSKQQLSEMIRRDRNKASIVLWSVANETPNTEARTKYLTTMVDLTHQLDPTRLVTAALLVRTEKNPAGGTTKIVDDPLGKALDVHWHQRVHRLVRATRGGRRHHHLGYPLRQAADHVRVGWRRQGRQPRTRGQQKSSSVDRGVSGRDLPPPDRDAQQDPAAARNQSLDPDGLPLRPPREPRLAGQLQPQGPHLRSGCQEASLLHSAESLQRQDPRQSGVVMMKRTLLLALFAVAVAPSIAATPATPDFGPNVLVFNPSMSSTTMQEQIDKVYAMQRRNEFGPERNAILFLPGNYTVDVPIGFYTQVLGLGASPDSVHISGNVHSDAASRNNNATTTFWRAAENFSVAPTGGTMQWAVSQAVPFRRMHVQGDIVLHQNGGWASGGWMSDGLIDGNVDSGTQQQWISRNSEWRSWTGSNWNMVFVGVPNPPEGEWPTAAVHQDRADSHRPRKTVPRRSTATGNYSVRVPALETNSSGISWHSAAPGKTIPIARLLPRPSYPSIMRARSTRSSPRAKISFLLPASTISPKPSTLPTPTQS